MNFEISNYNQPNNTSTVTLFYSNDESYQVNINNKCLNSLNYLNQELVNLGFSSIYLNDEEFSLDSNSLASSNILSIDFNSLIITIIEFIKRYRTQLPLLEKLQEQCHRLDKDNELHYKKQMQLRDLNETQVREIKNYEEKCRQFQIKLNKLNKTIKDDQEEIRKLKSFIEQRDAFYKHDRKKIDNEMHKLKEKLQQFITHKSQIYANIDMSDTLQRNSARQRGTWNSDSSKKQIDVYTHLIKDYDSRLKSLIQENGDIKQTITNIAIKLNLLCKHFKSSIKTEIDEKIEDNDHEFINNFPFENLNSKLEEYLKIKFGLIEEIIVNMNETTQTSNSRNKNTSDNQELNTTFTIDDDENENEDVNEENEDIIQNKSLNCSNISNKSKSVVKNDDDFKNQIEIKTLKNEIAEYKKLINTQNELINSFNQNLTINNDKSISFIEIEANSLIEERSKLAEEKKFYYKQKLQFEEEKLRYNQAVLQLAKQRKSFEEEKESFLKQKLYESFSKSFDVDENSVALESGRKTSFNLNNRSFSIDKTKLNNKK